MTLPLVACIIMIESSGNPLATNPTSTAAGLLGITDACMEDCSRISGKKFTKADKLNPDRALEMYNIYLGYYATEARLYKKPTAEDYARIWHCGFRGRETQEATDYWNAVKAKMEGRT